MKAGTQRSQVQVTTEDVQVRGRALVKRFRMAGIPQYFVWMQQHRPKWSGDHELSNRIKRLFNGRGSKRDAELLKECEVLADLLDRNQAA